MKWINFLHIYQPANIEDHHIKEAVTDSYLRIIRLLEEHSELKFTMNISGCLFDRWEELSFDDLIKRIKNLVERGQIELVGTAAYHPILPLISDQEIEVQIKENEAILKKHFGNNFKPKGFFFPEMAYSSGAAKIVKKMGYEWIIVDEITKNGKLEEIPFGKVYEDVHSGLKVIFRSRILSNSYVPQTLEKLLNDKSQIEGIVTATDGELYGLRHKDQPAILEKVVKRKGVQTQTISKYIAGISDVKKANLKKSNWESTEEELKKNIPYALWFNRKNNIHKALWKLANLASKIASENEDDGNYKWVRWHLVRGLASCTFWWASAKDFKNTFGASAWNPDEIEKGARELIKSIRSFEDQRLKGQKIKGEKIYLKIKKLIWRQHWK